MSSGSMSKSGIALLVLMLAATVQADDVCGLEVPPPDATALKPLADGFVLPGALPVLTALSPWQWFVMVSTGVSGALGHLLQIGAYRNAPASLLAPFGYVQIVSATATGWWIWGDFPGALSWLGIAIVCASGITIGWVEWRRRQAG